MPAVEVDTLPNIIQSTRNPQFNCSKLWGGGGGGVPVDLRFQAINNVRALPATQLFSGKSQSPSC